MAVTERSTFGDLLRRYRRAVGLTQEELAERAGLSVRGISDLERGVNRGPQRETVHLLASALGLDAEERAHFAATARRCRGSAAASPLSSMSTSSPTTAAGVTGRPASGRLPTPPTPLVGRVSEVAALAALLHQEEVHLVTLTGTGGVGKTRLALAVAHVARDTFTDGASFVDLAPLTDPLLVVATIAQALGIKETGSQPLMETLCETVGERHLLLLLDNVERVVDAAPDIAALCAACPRLVTLATSRVPLRLRGEHEIAVQPLSVPDPAHLLTVDDLAHVPAVALFVSRAQEVKADFTLTAATAPAVAAICARLDGLPLAIELAAARIKLLPPPTLLARLDTRLGLLVGGARDLPERQRTLRAALDWSHGLLRAAERILFARLSVFQNSRTLDAIETICNPTGDLDVLAALEALLANSLLGQVEVDGETHFTMLETLQEYAHEQLEARGETAALRAAHARYFLTLAEAAVPHLRGPEQARWLARLEREHDNLRAALVWALDAGDAAIGLRLGSALWRFWQTRGYVSEGRRWLGAVLQRRDEAPAALQAPALNGLGMLASMQGDYGRAAALYEEALALHRELGDQGGVASTLNNLGNVADYRGDFGRALDLHTEALARRRELGDTQGIADSLNNLGIVAWEQGDDRRAAALHAEALSLRRQLGDQGSIARSLDNLGNVANRQGDHERAMALHAEALALHRELGDRWGLAQTLTNLGNTADDQGDHERAMALHAEALALHRELGDRQGIATSLTNLGNVAFAHGDERKAAALFGEALVLYQALGDQGGLALALTNVGLVACAQGEFGQATTLLKDALAQSSAIGHKLLSVYAVEGLASAAGAQCQPARAARLFGAADAARRMINAPLPPNERPRHERLVAATRSQLEAQAFAAAWTAGQALTLEQAIAEALEEQHNAS